MPKVRRLPFVVTFPSPFGVYKIFPEFERFTVRYPDKGFPDRGFDTLTEAMENVQQHFTYAIHAQLESE